jgi:hypothetical protein
MPCFALPCRLRQGFAPPRPGQRRYPAMVGVSGPSLYPASVCGGGGSLPCPAPARSLRIALAYCRAAQWRHTLREARLHDHHRTNVGFALGTRYRVSSYRGARVLRLSAVFVHCFRSHFGSRLESLPGVYAPRVCWPDLRVDCVPVEVFTCSRRTASCTSGERLAVPRYNHPYTLVYLPGYLNHPSRVLGGSPPSPHVKARPRSFVDTGLAHRAPSSGAYGNQPSVCLRRSTETSSRAQRVLRALVQLQLFPGGVAQRHPLGFCTR